MKICVMPGVGFHEEPPKKFMKRLTDAIPHASSIFFSWQHQYSPPILPYKQGWLNGYARRVITEVIFDSQYAVLHGKTAKIPEADVYIAHSAGSIIALMQVEQKHIITMGSPAALMEQLESAAIVGRLGLRNMDPPRPILNIVNIDDIVASPIERPYVENWIYQTKWKIGVPFLTAHSDYWTNKKVMDKIIESISLYSNTINLK